MHMRYIPPSTVIAYRTNTALQYVDKAYRRVLAINDSNPALVHVRSALQYAARSFGTILQLARDRAQQAVHRVHLLFLHHRHSLPRFKLELEQLEKLDIDRILAIKRYLAQARHSSSVILASGRTLFINGYIVAGGLVVLVVIQVVWLRLRARRPAALAPLPVPELEQQLPAIDLDGADELGSIKQMASEPPHEVLLRYIYPQTSLWPPAYLRAFHHAAQSQHHQSGHAATPPSWNTRRSKMKWAGKVVLSRIQVRQDLKDGVVGLRKEVDEVDMRDWAWEGVEWIE